MNNKNSFLFEKDERIKKKSNFSSVIKNGKYLAFRLYNCFFLKNNLPKSRIGIIIKKKTGNSVERNYEKRIIREFFRHKKNLIKSAYDIVIIVKNKEGSFLTKEKEFEKIFLNILNNDNK